MDRVTPEQVLKAFSKWTGEGQAPDGVRWCLKIDSQEADPQMRMWVQGF